MSESNESSEITETSTTVQETVPSVNAAPEPVVETTQETASKPKKQSFWDTIGDDIKNAFNAVIDRKNQSTPSASNQPLTAQTGMSHQTTGTSTTGTTAQPHPDDLEQVVVALAGAKTSAENDLTTLQSKVSSFVTNVQDDVSSAEAVETTLSAKVKSFIADIEGLF